MWKAIKDYEGFYEVSDDGEVRSVDRDTLRSDGVVYHHKGRKLKQTVCVGRGTDDSREGYAVVNLRKPGSANVVLVHRLVAIAFIPNPNGLPTVNHKDGNKLNNSIANLEWASYSENNTHAITNQLRRPRGNEIIQYDKCGNFLSEYISACDAARNTGVSRESISLCLNHYTHSAGGFIWVKKSEGATTISKESTSDIDTDGSASRP